VRLVTSRRRAERAAVDESLASLIDDRRRN